MQRDKGLLSEKVHRHCHHSSECTFIVRDVHTNTEISREKWSDTNTNKGCDLQILHSLISAFG